MNKDVNRTLAISKLTDIYLKKKPELIEICILNKLKTVGTVYEIRTRLSNFYKGKSTFDDLEDTLNEIEKQGVIDTSKKNKIKDTDLETELNETITNNEKLNKEITESKKVYENLTNKAQDISQKIETIIGGCESYYQNKVDDYEFIDINNQKLEAGSSKQNFTRELSNITKFNDTVDQLDKTEVKEFVDNSKFLTYDNLVESGNNLYNNGLEQIINKQGERKLVHFYDEVPSVDYSITNKNLDVELVNETNLVSEGNTIVVIKGEDKKEQLISNIGKNQEKNIMSERPRALHVIPEHFSGNEDVKKFLRQYSMITEFNNWSEKDKISFLPMFVKGTASNFLDNLYNTKNNWTWKEIEEAFIEQYLPIGHITFLRTTLENKRQGESETATNFMTEIESLCRQIDNKMKEEDVCIYVLKGLKENILQTISMQDNTTLKKLKENLNKFELMQHRISNRGAITSEYTDMLNLQVIKLQKYHDDKEKEEKRKLQEENEEYKRRLDQISEEVRRLNILGRQSNKTVEFEGRYDEERYRTYNPDRETRGRNYDRNRDNVMREEYRYKSPYPGRSREQSQDSRGYNRGRSYSRENQKNNRDRSYSRERAYQQNNSYNKNRSINTYKRQDSRDRRSSRDRQTRSRTPERYRNDDRQEEMKGNMESVICYKCDQRGHYATQCYNIKN